MRQSGSVAPRSVIISCPSTRLSAPGSSQMASCTLASGTAKVRPSTCTMSALMMASVMGSVTVNFVPIPRSL